MYLILILRKLYNMRWLELRINQISNYKRKGIVVRFASNYSLLVPKIKIRQHILMFENQP
jgi:hypothetical protein